GWPEFASFDVIIVTAAPDHIPQPLVEQLKVGGRMVVPVGDWNQRLILITKDEKGITQQKDLPVVFVPMTGESQKK
ncbi:MAG: protein-L-isoaspartate O-methyltransferase, partial [Candidatus Lindowbacteria bacterium]|nr:protein-L-isoaspartate O-methyltransferase [Candidatus Lindowbacteria bacterium]